MSKNNENEPITVSVSLGSVTTDGTLLPLIHFPKKVKLLYAHILDGAGISASNSNYITLSLKSGSTVVGSLDSRAANQGALVQNVGLAMSLDSSYQVLAAASDLTMLYNETGTVAMTNAMVSLTYFPL